MIDWLERKGILNFHPEIKTRRQKVHALIYATYVIVVVIGCLWIAISNMSCTGEHIRDCGYACEHSGLKFKMYDNGKCECQ